MRALRTELARVVSVGRSAAWIAFESETSLRAASIAKQATRLRLVPGDLVGAQKLDDGRGLVVALEPRASVLERRTMGGRTKTMAANVDALVVVAAFERPPLYLPMVDELLAFAELHGLVPTVLFTKPDLVDAGFATTLRERYTNLGYVTIVVNSKQGEGVDAVRAALANRNALIVGQSGVGKSSLFRALGGDSVVGEVSKIGRGKQTTTTARLHRFEGGFLIDSPGFADFEIDAPNAADVAYGFVEFRAYEGKCKFTDCIHRDEPRCAVTAAVETGAISPERYASYRAIVARER